MTFCRSPFELSSLELASGIVFGVDDNVVVSWEEGETNAAPLAALEEALIPALVRPPCVVSFSGGRDSSVVLAVAARVAQREGLPPPIAATNVFPGVPSASETEWQELVIRHVGIADWVRVAIRAELDCVGPAATSILRRHGLLWPFNAHFHWPLLEIASGGSLLTGIGGDELLGTSQWAGAARVLAGGVRPSRRDAMRIAVASTPRSLRAVALSRASRASFPWLTAGANATLTHTLARELASEPLRRSRRWSWWRQRRQVGVGHESLELLARDHDVAIAHPLTEQGFACAVARFASRHRIFERTPLTQALFSALLPASLLERRSKACFDEIFWSDHSRRQASTAAVRSLDPATVDQIGLERAWQSPVPDAHSLLMLQALWLREADAKAARESRGPLGSDLDDGTVVGLTARL